MNPSRAASSERPWVRFSIRENSDPVDRAPARFGTEDWLVRAESAEPCAEADAPIRIGRVQTMSYVT
jgi:hypothetical protein